MRYIDADALDCLIWNDGEHGTTFDDGVSWILEKIDKLPTFEPPIEQKCCVCPHCNNCDVNDDGTITQKGTDADTVSRKAAIDAIGTILAPTPTQKDIVEDCLEIIENLPSAQPVAKDINVPVKDCISRQAAIDVLMEFDKKLRKINWYRYPYIEHECRGVDKAIVKIANLPSAQPVIRCKDCKNRGDDDCPMRFIEWVEYDDDGYIEYDDIIHDYTKDDGFCDRAERKTDG